MFFSFEGVEGSGKSTIIKLVKEQLEIDGYKVIVTREPGGTDIAEQIRNIILDNNNVKMDYLTEAYLYAASRSQHLNELIIPKLKDGYIVLCDRFIDSSLVYQGIARNLGIEKVYEINHFAIDECFNKFKHLTFFINTKPEVGLERIKKNRSDKKDRLDNEKLDFHKSVYNGYIKLSELYSNRIVVVNDDTIDNVKNDILSHIRKLVE